MIDGYQCEVLRHAECCKEEPPEQVGASRDSVALLKGAFERRLKKVKKGVQWILGEDAASPKALR